MKAVFQIYLLSYLLSTMVLAQERLIQVDIPARFEADQAIGILLSADQVLQKPIKKLETTRHGTVVVGFEYLENEIRPDTVATAMLVSKDGEIAFGNVKPVLMSPADASAMLLPVCPSQSVPIETLRDQGGLLENLVATRLARRSNAQLRLSRTMDTDFLKKTRKLEKGFGLTWGEQLDPEMSPSELIDRLSRLVQAIKNVRKK